MKKIKICQNCRQYLRKTLISQKNHTQTITSNAKGVDTFYSFDWHLLLFANDTRTVHNREKDHFKYDQNTC